MRIVLLLLLVLALALSAAAAWLYRLARAAEPVYSGEVSLPGLGAAVTVDFDSWAVPHVQAPDLAALAFAQGYLTAAERMWQMDLLRRLARGRLAEVLGPKALATDRLFRVLGLGGAARRSLAAAEPRVKALLAAYARGVNAYRETHAGRLPLEYRIAAFEPAPWEPVDSLAIGDFMAFCLSFNVREELVWLRLARRLGLKRSAELFPTDEGIPAPADLPALPRAALPQVFAPYLRLARRLGLPQPGPASNAWAVAASRGADGRPLLANDPHLAPSMPVIFHQVELQTPGLHVAGVTIPGIPLVLIGHNADLAWGLTTAMADNQDLFLEQLSGDGRSVRRDGRPVEPLRESIENIWVRGREKPVIQRVRSSSHGVILNDVLGPVTGTALDLPRAGVPWLLALRWSLELPDTAMTGVYRLDTAKTLAEGRDAARQFLHASQNFVFAHRDGGIAWQVSGALPRRLGGSGAFPSPGWDPRFGWGGYHPLEQNPGLEDPPDGLLVSANDRRLPPRQAARIGHFWMPPFRARRIRELLDAAPGLNPGTMAAIQGDRHSLQARALLKRLAILAPAIRALDPAAGGSARMLLAWDGEMAPGSAPAALYALLRPALYQALFGDELGEDLGDYMDVSTESWSALDEAIHSGRSSFWDDVDTPVAEGPAAVFVRALNRARAELEARQGAPGRWRLDRLRRLVFPHAFHRVPVLRSLFDVGPVGVGGGDHTVNVMKTLPRDPATPAFVPSWRMVLTPGEWSRSRGSLPLGQSGHRFSPHRSDQLADWLAVRGHPLYWGGVPEAQRLGRLRLVPPGE